MTPPKPAVPIGTVIRAQPQRHNADCTVTALANLLCVDYEIALSALAQVAPNVILRGAYGTAVRKAARFLGVSLAHRRTFDWDEDTGVLIAFCKAQGARHAVVLSAGRIIDDGSVWPADVWRATRRAIRCTLLVVEGM